MEEYEVYYLRSRNFKRKTLNGVLKQKSLLYFLKKAFSQKVITQEEHDSLKEMIMSTDKGHRYIAQQILNFKVYGEQSKILPVTALG